MGLPPQGELVSPSYEWHQTNERGIPHTAGIHRIVVDRKKGKKGEKKRFNLLHLEKGGSPKVAPFFQSWNKRALPKWLPTGTKCTYGVLAKEWKKRKKVDIVKLYSLCSIEIQRICSPDVFHRNSKNWNSVYGLHVFCVQRPNSTPMQSRHWARLGKVQYISPHAQKQWGEIKFDIDQMVSL